MKLRIRGNSIRLRLVQKEVESFRKRNIVKETTLLPGSKYFSYLLKQGEEFDAELHENTLSINVPFNEANKWCNSEQVGINHTFLINDSQLKLIIEKDFKCLDPNRMEDESDNFENPTIDPQHQNC